MRTGDGVIREYIQRTQTCAEDGTARVSFGGKARCGPRVQMRPRLRSRPEGPWACSRASR
eukprot:scaffold30166_cov132-Isochrysis_galbana.AAC.1